MSGIGGLLFPPNAAIDRPSLARLSRPLAHRGPEGEVLAELGRAAMVCRRSDVAGPPRSPCPHLHDGRLLVVWDGRLDNRAELEHALGVRGERLDAHQLMARAYDRWGRDFAARVVGDFALALWDAPRRRLLLARDPFGARPLFYARYGDRFAWASTLIALGHALEHRPELDEAWVVAYLSFVKEDHRTPYAGFRAVPPGYVLELEDGELRRRRFWRPDDAGEVRYRRDEEYEAHFRELFLDAVRCRLESSGPVLAQLSGGLDSSSIVCAADHLLRRGEASAPDLVTLSEVYDLSPTSNELPFIRRVEAHVGRTAEHQKESEFLILADLHEVDFEIPTPLECFKDRHHRTLKLMAAYGSRVLLSGIGGDQLLRSQVGDPVELGDLVVAGRWRELPAALRQWHAEQHKPYPLLLWQGVLRPLLPAALRRWTMPLVPLPEWYERPFARRVGRRLLAAAADEGSFRLPTKRLQAAAIRQTIRTQCWKYDQGPAPVEVRFPFLHRPLVELCLGMPAEQLVRPGETRSIHRRALADLLPPEITWRRDKKGPYEAILRAFAREWPRLDVLLRDAAVCRRGWVSPRGFRRALEEARFGRGFNLMLVHVLALESWLRELEAGRWPGARNHLT